MNLRIVVLSITIVLATGFANRVFACGCLGTAFGPDYRQRADVVFVGKVVAKRKSDAVEKDGVEVTLEVERVWKGTIFKRTFVYTGATGDLYPFIDSCAIPFLMDQHYVVFAYRWHGQLVTDVCTGSGGFPYANEVIKQLGPGKPPRRSKH